MISLVGELDFGEAKSSRYFIYLAQKNSQKRLAFVNKVSKNQVR